MADAQETGATRRELAKALGLMYTAPERFTSVSVELREWSDPGLLDEAQQAWRERERSRGSLIAPIGERRPGGKPSGLITGAAQYHCVKRDSRELVCSRLQVSANSDGVLVPGSGTLLVEEMLQPASLLSDATFSLTGTRIVAGRRGIEVRAVRRRQWHESSDQRLWAEPDEFHLVVDAERGILLSATALFQGRPIANKEFRSISFGEPLPPLNARWETIGEVVGLLYTAQHNFATVRAEVREWWNGGDARHRLVAANPPRFLKESIAPDGQQLGLDVYDGDIWWSYYPPRQTATTGAPMPSLPPEFNARFSPHPLTPGDDVYQTLDAEYAIIQQRSLNPSCLLSAWWLEPLERTAFAGREAIRVRGETNLNGIQRYWWENVNQCELLVDAERGTLLRLAGIPDSMDGREAIGHEVTAIEFDGPVADDEFRFTPPPGASVNVAWWSDSPPPPSYRYP